MKAKAKKQHAEKRQWHESKMVRLRVKQCWKSSLTACMMFSCTLLSTFTAWAQLCELVIERFFRFQGFRRALMEKKLLCCSSGQCLLSESKFSSLERKRTDGTSNMDSWNFFEGSLTSVTLQQQRPAPGQVMAAAPTKNLSRLHLFACLSMSQDRTTTYRVTTCTTATWLALIVWHVRRFPARYNKWRRPRWVDQNERSFLSCFFHFLSKNSAETWNNMSPRSIKQFDGKN